MTVIDTDMVIPSTLLGLMAGVISFYLGWRPWMWRWWAFSVLFLLVALLIRRAMIYMGLLVGPM